MRRLTGELLGTSFIGGFVFCLVVAATVVVAHPSAAWVVMRALIASGSADDPYDD